METPTLITQIQGHDFTITAPPETLTELAQAYERQQRLELATHIGRELVAAPVRATKVLVLGIGRAVAHNVHEAYEDWELRSHDQKFGTDLYARKQRQLTEARTQALVRKVGL